MDNTDYLKLPRRFQDAYKANELIQKKIEANSQFRRVALRFTSIKYFQGILNLAISKELQEHLVLEIDCSDYDYSCTAKGKSDGWEYSFHLLKLDNGDMGWRFRYQIRKNWSISQYCPFDSLEEELIKQLGKWQNMAVTQSSEEDCEEDEEDDDVLENYSDYYDDETPC